MVSRALFVLVTLFWVTMNVLLWREEAGSKTVGGTVPLELVWQKMLTAPDSSSLVIFRHGRRAGVCHWITGASEDWAQVSDENVPSGMPRQNRGYSLRLEGSVIVEEWTNRLRFDGTVQLAPDTQWRELEARLNIRPTTWEIHSSAAQQIVHFKVDTGAGEFQHDFRFADLGNPLALFRGFAGPVADELLNEIGLTELPTKEVSAPPLKWDASEDRLRIGHTPLPVYRLQTRVMGRYPVSVLVSRVGEILRVELPGEVELRNDRLAP